MSASASHPKMRELIDQLRRWPDLMVREQEHSWLVEIVRENWICEVVVPRTALEWFATVKRRIGGKDLWSDWMDYRGYDRRTDDELATEMAGHIEAFVLRARGGAEPAGIWSANPTARSTRR